MTKYTEWEIREFQPHVCCRHTYAFPLKYVRCKYNKLKPSEDEYPICSYDICPIRVLKVD